MNGTEPPMTDIDYGALVDVLGDRQQIADALRGAMAALEPFLVWTERQYDTGCWHVTVSIDGCAWFGNDGHLLSQDREACRFVAFASLMQLLAEDETETD